MEVNAAYQLISKVMNDDSPRQDGVTCSSAVEPSDGFPNIGLLTHDDRWLARYPNLYVDAERAVRAVFAQLKLKGSIGDVSVVFAGDDFMRGLNLQYRQKDSATNVLSFPFSLEIDSEEHVPNLLGDIVLAYETVCQEAESQEKPIADHVRHLLVHGVLHLLGYDHEENTQAGVMEKLEVDILRSLGVSDPYAPDSQSGPDLTSKPALAGSGKSHV